RRPLPPRGFGRSRWFVILVLIDPRLRTLPRGLCKSHLNHGMSFCLLYPRRVSEPLNVFDYEALAASRLGPGAYAYYAGGANDELTLHDNVAAYRRWQLRPRVLRDVASPRSEEHTSELQSRVDL